MPEHNHGPHRANDRHALDYRALDFAVIHENDPPTFGDHSACFASAFSFHDVRLLRSEMELKIDTRTVLRMDYIASTGEKPCVK